MNCLMCGRRISPFMEKEAIDRQLCEMCHEIKKMDQSGALAKNGLMKTDLM